MFCLKVPSDPEWADRATDSIEEILVDHAHCEMKAASNAMSLATRIPHDFVIVRELVALAQEELRHFEEVVGYLEKRGLRLGPPPVDDYAAALRSAPPKLPASPFGSNGGIVDRLLVGALIEARSCERFKLLIERLDPAREPELRSFYETLFAAEARHYRTLVDLATRAGGGRRDEVMARLERLSELEAGIVQRLAAREERAAIHG
jgi:tRNA 2-(methylsulfanyl)-N6-isopentenyladenosine37 hydroxylase